MSIHAVLGHIFQTSTLSTYAGDKQESVRHDLANIFQHGSLRSPHHIHQLTGIIPRLADTNNAFEKVFSIGIAHHLKVLRTFVRGQCQKHRELACITQERADAVLSHIRRNGEGIHLQMLEERTGIHITRIADISTLGIGYDKLIGVSLSNVFDRLFKRVNSEAPHALIESHVGLESHTVFCRSIDDGFVESQNRIIFIQ